jgi:hypothetical protein
LRACFKSHSATVSPHPERKEARGSIASEAVRNANATEAGDWREA